MTKSCSTPVTNGQESEAVAGDRRSLTIEDWKRAVFP